MTEPSELARTLREARSRRGLSQVELARLLGLTQTTVSRAERGADIHLSTLIQIARGLGLELLLVPRSLVPAIDQIAVSSREPLDVFDPDTNDVYHEDVADGLEDRLSGTARPARTRRAGARKVDADDSQPAERSGDDQPDQQEQQR
ncbi:MAG: helix-turn-helix transcriptional regulator [Vulcanimicrobiaceae bacterium]